MCDNNNIITSSLLAQKLPAVFVYNTIPTPPLGFAIFNVATTVGKGSFGAVYVPQENPDIVIKEYKYYVDTDPIDMITKRDQHQKIFEILDKISMTIKETIFMSNLNHPNIMKLIGVILSEDKVNLRDLYRPDQITILKQYTPHAIFPRMYGDVYALRNTFNYPPDENSIIKDTHTFFTQMLSALTYLHLNGILHSDIKPGNILYNKNIDGEISFFLTDFGISKFYSIPEPITNYITTDAFGPSSHAHPRMATRDNRFYGKSTISLDLYNLALTGYFLMTGIEITDRRMKNTNNPDYDKVYNAYSYFILSNKKTERVNLIKKYMGDSGWALFKDMLGLSNDIIVPAITALNYDYIKNPPPLPLIGGENIYKNYSVDYFLNLRNELAYLNPTLQNYKCYVPYIIQSNVNNISIINAFNSFHLSAPTYLFAMQIYMSLPPDIINNYPDKYIFILGALFIAISIYEIDGLDAPMYTAFYRYMDQYNIVPNALIHTVFDISNVAMLILKKLDWKPILIPYLIFIENIFNKIMYDEHLAFSSEFIESMPSYLSSLNDYNNKIKKFAYFILIYSFVYNNELYFANITLEDISSYAVRLAIRGVTNNVINKDIDLYTTKVNVLKRYLSTADLSSFIYSNLASNEPIIELLNKFLINNSNNNTSHNTSQ